MGEEIKRITYPEPKNFKFILRYYKTKIDKYIKAFGNRDMLRTHAKDISKLLVGDINDYEMAIYDRLPTTEDVKCTRCKSIIHKQKDLVMRDNKSFCPNCGLIRLTYIRKDITDYSAKYYDGKTQAYLSVNSIIVHKDLYNKALMSVLGKFKSRLEKYINGDLDAIEKSEDMKENN